MLPGPSRMCTYSTLLVVLLLVLLLGVAARLVNAQSAAGEPGASLGAPSVPFTASQRGNTRRFLMAFARRGSALHGIWGGSGDFCDWPLVTCEQDGVRITDDVFPDVPFTAAVSLPEVPEDVNASEVMLVGISSPRSCSRWTFSGTLPASWGRLTQLLELELETGALSGTLPAEWASLASLRKLNLSHNHLSGSLPEAWTAMRNVVSLDLANNSLHGWLPVEWSSMSELWHLDLKFNWLTGTLPPAYAQMKSLHFLDLRDNYFSGCVPAAWRHGGVVVAVEAHLEAEGCRQGPVRGVSPLWTVRWVIGALWIASGLVLLRCAAACELRDEGSSDSDSAFDIVSARYLDSTDDDHEVIPLEETHRTDLPECV